MKKICLICIICIYNFVFSQQKTLVLPKNPKIGLSLSGGGAKGFAHIGVIKVLDSLGVKISYVSGTSMGAIIGGLYSAGYSGKEMEIILLKTDIDAIIADEKIRSESSLFKKNNEKYFLSFPIKNKKILLPTSLSKGQRTVNFMNELYKDVRNIKDFRKLPIPFLCVATNLETGKPRVFEEGDISESIMASAAFPSLLDPVKISDSLYIDGGVSINYPSELLRKKGMDVVIGVNLDQGLDKLKDINNFIKILSQIINFGIEKNYKEQQKFTDIDINPNLKGIGITNFENKQSIIDSGFAKALEFLPLLKKLPQNSFVRIKNNYLRNPILNNIYKIDRLELENSNRFDINYVKGKMGLKLPILLTYDRIAKMIDLLYSTENYNLIKYEIKQEDLENVLVLNVDESTDYNFFKVGLHYDKIFSSGLLLNYSSKKFLFHNSNLSLDLVLGSNPRYNFNYFIDNGYLPGFGLNSSAFSFSFLNTSGNLLINQWKVFRNEIFIESILGEKIGLGGGISYDYLEKDDNTKSIEKNKFLNPYLFMKADTQDNTNFPTKGILLNAEAKIYNFNDILSNEKSIQIYGNFNFNFALSKILTIQSKTFLGVSINKTPTTYLYRTGGYFEQKILNFNSFASRNLGEIFSPNILSLNNALQIKILNNYYIIPNIHILSSFDDFGIFKFNYKNIGLSVAYNSIIGELRANYSHDLLLNKGLLNFTFGYWF